MAGEHFMTVKRMYLQGDKIHGFKTAPWHRVREDSALAERDNARYVPGALNWADRTLKGVPVSDQEHLLDKLPYASLYEKENGQLMLLERF